MTKHNEKRAFSKGQHIEARGLSDRGKRQNYVKYYYKVFPIHNYQLKRTHSSHQMNRRLFDRAPPCAYAAQ